MDLDKKNPVVLVGLGELARELLPSISLVLGKKPDFLYDNNKDFWGKKIFDIECLNYSQLAALPRDTKIVLATRLADQIFEQFIKIGFENTYALSFERGEARIRDVHHCIDSAKIRNSLPSRERTLAGSWCYISGASRGIGAFLASIMAEQGVNIFAHARNKSSLENIALKLQDKNVKTILSAADLSEESQLNNHCEEIAQKCPQLDFAYVNAGISLPISSGSFEEGSVAGWAKTYQVNVIAPWKIAYTLLKSARMVKNGKVFFISSSISGRLSEAAYACSKMALNKMVTDLAKTSKARSAEFCLIDPGWISTDMGGQMAPNNVETLFPGIIFPAATTHSCNGSWISAQDYRGLSVEEAIKRAYHLGDLKEN